MVLCAIHSVQGGVLLQHQLQVAEQEGDASPMLSCRLDLSVHDFEVVRVLGEGSLSTVFLALWKAKGSQHALKVIDKTYIARHNMTEAVIRERHIMDRLVSDCIVELQFTFQVCTKIVHPANAEPLRHDRYPPTLMSSYRLTMLTPRHRACSLLRCAAVCMCPLALLLSAVT